MTRRPSQITNNNIAVGPEEQQIQDMESYEIPAPSEIPPLPPAPRVMQFPRVDDDDDDDDSDDDDDDDDTTDDDTTDDDTTDGSSASAAPNSKVGADAARGLSSEDGWSLKQVLIAVLVSIGLIGVPTGCVVAYQQIYTEEYRNTASKSDTLSSQPVEEEKKEEKQVTPAGSPAASPDLQDQIVHPSDPGRNPPPQPSQQPQVPVQSPSSSSYPAEPAQHPQVLVQSTEDPPSSPRPVYVVESSLPSTPNQVLVQSTGPPSPPPPPPAQTVDPENTPEQSAEQLLVGEGSPVHPPPQQSQQQQVDSHDSCQRNSGDLPCGCNSCSSMTSFVTSLVSGGPVVANAESNLVQSVPEKKVDIKIQLPWGQKILQITEEEYVWYTVGNVRDLVKKNVEVSWDFEQMSLKHRNKPQEDEKLLFDLFGKLEDRKQGRMFSLKAECIKNENKKSTWSYLFG